MDSENQGKDKLRLNTGLVESNSTIQDRIITWNEGFTNVFAHDPEKYRYLVHGLAGISGRAMQIGLDIELAKKGVKGKYIDLTFQPNRISEKPVISTSIIDQDHRETWGNVGFILKAPHQNVLGMYSRDVGTSYWDPTSVERPGLNCTVDELLEQSSPSALNEVVISGSSQYGQVEIQAVFIKVNPDGTVVDPIMARTVKHLSQEMFITQKRRVPIIQIITSNTSSTESKVTINDIPDHPLLSWFDENQTPSSDLNLRSKYLVKKRN